MENIANVLYLSMGVMALVGVLYLGVIIYQKFKKDRKNDFSQKNIYNYFLGFLVLAPVLACLYFFPIAFYDQDFWLESKSQYLESQNALKLLGLTMLGFYAIVRASIFFPHKDEYYNIGSKLLFLSLIPGAASAINVMIISKFITEDYDAKYLLFFFRCNHFCIRSNS